MTTHLVEYDGVSVLLLDALTDFVIEQSDFVLVTGTHAGLDSARRVLRKPPRLAIFSDAGVGKDRSGVAGLELLDEFRIAAAAVDVNSARIGDAADTLENGVVSHLNRLARELGLAEGARVREALLKLRQ